ncbi:Hypothetical protein FKW44_018508, partial [Caligus rogercresseyi]
MNDEENKLLYSNPRYNAPLYTSFGYNEPPGASRTSLRYTNLSSLYLRIPNFLELAEQASYITNL